MKIVCTICSKKKDEDEKLMPARLRYSAPHIQLTDKTATEAGLPFFILSGKYGLIEGEKEIPYYDYYLEEKAVDDLVKILIQQINDYGITEIDFYTEEKESWLPYQNAIRKSSESTGILLNVYPLLESK